MTIASHRLASGDVIGFFLSHLELAGAVAKELLSNPLAEGDFFALAPAEESEARLRQFSTGGLLPSGETVSSGDLVFRRVQNLVEPMAALISDRARELRMPWLFLHEPYLRQSEIRGLDGDRLTQIGGGLFKVISADDFSPSPLAHELGRYTVSWHALCVLADRVEMDDRNTTLGSAKLIAVGAYDGESYIYWLRRGVDSSEA